MERNSIKPVIPPRRRGDAKPASSGKAIPLADDAKRPRGRSDYSPSGREGEGFDAERGSSVRRERGDSVDPAGPKRSTVMGTLGTGGAVTDPSGTTGPTSRSNDRLSTTTGKLRDRDLERSARMGEAPDINVLNIPTGDSSFSVPVLMAVLAGVIGVLGLIAYLSWPTSPADRDDATPRAGDSVRLE